MRYTRYVVAIGLLAFAVQARADWVGSDITDIINNVKTILAEVMGDVRDTAGDLKRQLNILIQQGDTLKEHVQDAADLMVHRRGPLLNFVYLNGDNSNPRCGPESTCMNFRLDLENFVLDMADLKNRFPQIEKNGLGDGTIFVDVIDHMPPLVLFGFYDIFNKVPGWQDIPQNLSNLYDEIGDADAFSAELPQAGAATGPHVDAKRKGPSTAGTVTGEANFGLQPVTQFDTFCGMGKQLTDQVSVNRWINIVTLFANYVDVAAEFSPASANIVIAGEGGELPIPVKGLLKTVGKVIQSILFSLNTHRTNVGLCKQVESDVASCRQLVDYRTQAGTLKAYWVVKGVQRAHLAFLEPGITLLAQAGNLYGESKYKEAYSAICQAYGAIL